MQISAILYTVLYFFLDFNEFKKEISLFIFIFNFHILPPIFELFYIFVCKYTLFF